MNDKFDLQLAIAGEPFEKEDGTTVSFVAYIPTAKEDRQLIVQDMDDVLAYYANGRYINQFISSPFDLRMKSLMKQIDWTKLPVDTLLTLGVGKGKIECYFSSFRYGVVRCYQDGMTSKTAASNSDVFTINPSNVQIAPDQPWAIWQGGEFPIPDGLEFEYMTSNDLGKIITSTESASAYVWTNYSIYAYRLTGKVFDGYSL